MHHRVLRLVTVAAVLSLAPVTTHAQAQAGVKGPRYPQRLLLLDRQGNLLDTFEEPSFYVNPVLSPDGTQIAVVMAQVLSEPGGQGDLWVFDIPTGEKTRLTSDPDVEVGPVWSPNGTQIAYSSFSGDFGSLYRTASNGEGGEELLFTERGLDMPLTDWSSDGRLLSYEAGDSLWVVPLGGEPTATELVREEYSVHGGRFSPGGRFLAYLSDESGRHEVYVRPLDPFSGIPAGEEKWQVSNLGGLGLIQWRNDGQELYYLGPDGGVMAVEVSTTPAFRAGVPRLLFRAPSSFDLEEVNHEQCSCTPYACEGASISRNGQRFVFAVRTSPDRQEVRVAAEILAPYAGTYLMPNGFDLVISLEDGRLMAEIGGRLRFTLRPVSETEFGSDIGLFFEFVRNEAGLVTHFIQDGAVRVDRVGQE